MLFLNQQPFTPTPFLNAELQYLLDEVAQLRRETDSYRCSCNLPDCPFNNNNNNSVTVKEHFDVESEKESPDLGFGSMEDLNRRQTDRDSKNSKKMVRYSMPPTMKLQLESPPLSHHRPLSLSAAAATSKSLTNIPRGVQKRADGTILEADYPGRHGQVERRKHSTFSGFSMAHLSRLSVSFEESLEADCLVDQDGLMNNEDYIFVRQAPERKLVRNVRRHRSIPHHHKSSDNVLCLTRQGSSEPNIINWAKKRLSTASS